MWKYVAKIFGKKKQTPAAIFLLASFAVVYNCYRLTVIVRNDSFIYTFVEG